MLQQQRYLLACTTVGLHLAGSLLMTVLGLHSAAWALSAVEPLTRKVPCCAQAQRSCKGRRAKPMAG
jgi:hypothetical protein